MTTVQWNLKSDGAFDPPFFIQQSATNYSTIANSIPAPPELATQYSENTTQERCQTNTFKDTSQYKGNTWNYNYNQH